MKQHKAFLFWFDNSTIRHLRYPFSFFLMPVYLFALSQAHEINWTTAILGFVIIHGLLFPSTNGYNSFQDHDDSSIGGLKHPPPVSKKLFYATLLFDVVAVLAGLFISFYFSAMLMLFITMSHLYSYRKIRLKQFPFIAFLVVFIFQGGFVYMMSSLCINPHGINTLLSLPSIQCMAISSLFIGSMYPLTQIYQHEADKHDGVISLSYKLGYRGTFIFSGILFFMAIVLLFIYLSDKSQLLIFVIFISPVVLRLGKWYSQVQKSITAANYENTMSANLISSVCMNSYFLMLIVLNQIRFF